MRLFQVGFVGVFALAVPFVALAQGEDEGEEAAAEAPPPAEVGAAQDKTFKIKRGLFAEGDLGVFVTLGGINTNSVNLSDRTFSNIQPYVGLTFGYDLFHTDSFDLGVGVRLAMGLNGGAGRPLAAGETPNEANTRSNDYSLQEAGVAINMVIMVTERLAMTVKLDGGAGFLSPDPTLSAANASGGPVVDQAIGGTLFAPVFGAAVGLELYTLLNDFSIGIQARFVGAIGNGEFIPGLSGTIPIKYTF